MRRIANSFNEHAQMYNRISKAMNVIGVISDYDLIGVLTAYNIHTGLPQHMPTEKLKARRKIREFKNIRIMGRIQ